MASKLPPPRTRITNRVAADQAKPGGRGAERVSRKSKSGSDAEKGSSENAIAAVTSFPVVAIGASAGGLEAYTEFFHALPADTGMAFVLVQHLDPSHHSMLAEILAKATKMPVEEVKVKPRVKIKPNCVYVIPSGTFMAIARGALILTPRSKGPGGQHLAVNFFMRSLAEERKSGAIGIVFSGTGTDGTSGVEDIKAEGGLTFAQEPATAKYDGMPRSAVDSGCMDFILRPKEIAKELARIQRHPYLLRQEKAKAEQGLDLGDSVAPEPRDKDFTSILDQLRKTSGVDFRQYKPNTIHRRALRRMVILKQDSLGEYAKHLKENPEEAGKLFDDVLIPVTSFFRDFEAFEALKTQVYPSIVKDKANKGTIRMWAPGCSTGEETYSLAMTLLEFLGDKAASFQVQIFGTDLNEKGIQHARSGVYRASIAEEISPERMSRFFIKVAEGYRVNKAVRDMCVFARQNLASDPPFSQMNLVACRNLLIYIQPVLQKKIIPILHYALKASGFLVLGSSESVNAFPDLFSVVDKKHKIYSKKSVASRLHYDFVQSYYPAYPAGSRLDLPGRGLKRAVPASDELDVQAEADRLVLKHHAPVGVVINSAMEVVQFRGRTTPYLEPAPGKPSLNVLKLARNGLAMELRTLIGAAAKKCAAVNKSGVPFDGDGPLRTLNLSVTPLGVEQTKRRKGAQERGPVANRFYLVLFDDVTPLWTPDPKDGSPREGKANAPTLLVQRETKRWKQEVASAQDALRSAIESEDALKEEFQSANEEILSANEELQSTNEELETSKEELQSANEELNTLNAELRNKNSDLHDVSNDISNFLNSTRIPVVMLDLALCIRRLTPTADKLLKVQPSDIGRPLADMRSNIAAPELEQLVAKVLDSLQPVEREVRDLQGHWHSLNILPYRTQDNRIDGVVLSLQDIDAVKAASEQLRKSSDFFRTVLDTVRGPLLVLDQELCILSANKSFLNSFQVSPEETVGRFIYDLGNGQWNIPKLRGLLERVLSQHEAVTDFELEHDFERIGHKTMVLNAQIISWGGVAQHTLLLSIDYITERKVAVEERFRMIADNMSQLAWSCEELGNVTWYNQRWLDYTGMTLKEMAGWDWSKVQHPDHLDRVVQGVKRSAETGEIWEDIFPLRGKGGTYRWFLTRAVPILDEGGKVVRWFGTNTDIPQRKLAEAALIKSEKLAAAGRLAATLAHEINNPLQAITNLITILRQSPRVDNQDREYANMAAEELDRVAHLTRQSLSFYRDITLPSLVNLEDALDSTLNLYARQIEAQAITVTKQYRSHGTTINSYPGEIRQVFSTLLINAIEAVSKGGRFTLRISKSRDWGKNPASNGLRVTLVDSGCGIPPHHIERVFEPFFTTKGKNGTGLGLWVAHGIVSRLGGSMFMRSRVHPPGQSGTCFSVFLPKETSK